MIQFFNVNSLKIPSLALATIKALYDQEFNDRGICISDIEAMNPAEFRTAIRNLNSEMFGFTVSGYNLKQVVRYSHVLKDEHPNSLVILGGPIVSSRRYSLYLLEKYLAIDFIIRGRADNTFLELVEKLRHLKSRPIDHDLGINNISYRINGKPYVSPDKKQNNSGFVSLSPWIEETQYLLDEYVEHSNTYPLPYSTGYGCPNKCGFCAEAQQQFTLFPIKRVEAELELILSRKPKRIFIFDSTLGYTRERALFIMGIIRKHNKGSRILCYANISHIDNDYCEMAEKANVCFIGVGLQTIHSQTCDSISRHKIDLERFRQRVNSDRFQNLSDARVSLIYGLPGETYEHFKKSLNFALSLRSNYNLGPYRYCYYPGTYIYEHNTNYKSKSETDPEIVKSPYMTEEELKQCNMLAAYYIVLQRCFPFFLMSMTYFHFLERSTIIEQFAMNCYKRLPQDFMERVREISLANKEEKSLQSLHPIIESLYRSPVPAINDLVNAYVAACKISGILISVSSQKLLTRWLLLDLRQGKLLQKKQIREVLQDRGRWESIINGLLKFPNQETRRQELLVILSTIRVDVLRVLPCMLNIVLLIFVPMLEKSLICKNILKRLISKINPSLYAR